MRSADVAIVGGGAAGLATAIFAARRSPDGSIVILDGAARLGAKILVSGGGRCNVTNASVRPEDFHGGSRRVIGRVLRAFDVPATVAFFREIGVPLHEEEHGKLFPDSNRARTVLEALVGEARRRGVTILTGRRVSGILRRTDRFELTTPDGTLSAGRVVLATGGLSLPKTGSDGTGYDLARSLGHSLVPTTPALVPLVLEGDFHAPLAGVAQDVELTIRAEGARPARFRGAMLWTHFGVSGPAVLDASRAWHRARIEGRDVHAAVSFLPGETFESLDHRLITLAGEQPRSHLQNVLASLLPSRVAEAILERANVGGRVPMAHLSREDRRRLVHALLDWPLPVLDSRGYGHAEVTAGGVPLEEIDPATMESRKCPGLHLVGEVLDIDGRIGGFNFQWAWSSGCVAGLGTSP